MSDVIWDWANRSIYSDNTSADYPRVAKLSDTKFVAMYANGSEIRGKVGIVTGTTVAWGTEVQLVLDAFPVENVSICYLDTDKFVVTYSDNDQADDGYTRICSVSGDVITVHDAVEFINADAENTSCCRLTSTKYVIIFNDETDSDCAKGVVCTVSGTTPTPGTPVDITVGTDYNLKISSVCRMADDKFATIFHAFEGTTCEVVVGTVSDSAITFGTVVEVSSDSPETVDICCPDTDKLAMIYSTSLDKIYYRLATVSTRTITLDGSAVDTGLTALEASSICDIDSTHALIGLQVVGNVIGESIYLTINWSAKTATMGDVDIIDLAEGFTQGSLSGRNVDIEFLGGGKVVFVFFSSDDNKTIAVVGDVNTDKTVWGTSEVYTSQYTNYKPRIVKIGTNKVVCAAFDSANDYVYAKVANITGTDLAWGNEVAITPIASNEYDTWDICELADDKFVVVYKDPANGSDGYTRICSISDTTITANDHVEFEDATIIEALSCCRLTDTKYAIAFNDFSDSDTGKAIICTVDGTVPTPGTAVDFSVTDWGPQEIAMCRMADDKFAVVFVAADDLSTRMVVGTIGDTTVITFGSVVELNTNVMYSISICCPDTDKLVVIYGNGGSAGEPYYRVCTVSTRTITLGTETVLWHNDVHNPQAEQIVDIDETHILVCASEYFITYGGASHLWEVDWDNKVMNIETRDIFETGDIQQPVQSCKNCLGLVHLGSGKVCCTYYLDDANDYCYAIVGDVPFGEVVWGTTFKIPIGTPISWYWNSGQYGVASSMCSIVSNGLSWNWDLVQNSSNAFYRSGSELRWSWVSGSQGI